MKVGSKNKSGGLSQPFILRPVATTLFMLAILLVGLLSYRLLPVSALPEVDYPTIQIITRYPGASPELMAARISAPLERQLGQLSGLKQMFSQNSAGISVITLQFQLTLALDIAEQEVQAAINSATNLLPTDLPYPPIYNKVNPADPPILSLAVTSDVLPTIQVQDLVESRISQKISQVTGVGLVSLSGGQRRAFRIKINAPLLAHYGLTSEAIYNAINAANTQTPKGNFDGPKQSITITTNDQMKSVEDYLNLIITYQNSAAIRLKDVAYVTEEAENTQLAAWADKHPAIIINVQRQPGANVLTTTDRINQLLPTLTQSLPHSVNITVLTDRTNTIRASISDVQFELLLAVVLVIMVIYLFLRNTAATLIPSIAVPLSLIGTFAAMYLLGFSINNLTLMALTIATGFVVDDAIVVIENITRYIEEGEKPLQAALKGASEISFTIISLTFSLIAVLIPLLFMEDIVGRLFREFAITLAVAILISAVVSLTLTPMMCGRLLKLHTVQKQNRFALLCEHFFERVIYHYGNALSQVLKRPALTLAVALSTFFCTIFLYLFVQKGFFPIQDNGLIQGTLVAPQSISFPEMARRQQQVAHLILQDPAVESLSSFIGIDSNNVTLNSGRLQINLKPLAERKQRIPEVIARIQKETKSFADLQLYLQPSQDLTMETQASRTQYQFSLQSLSADELALYIPHLLAKLNQLPELTEVSSNFQNQGLEAFITVDRDTASRLGVSMSNINNALYNAFGQRMISTLYTQSNQYRVVLEQNSAPDEGISALSQLYVLNDKSQPILLTSVAKIEQRQGMLSIHRLDRLPSVTLFFNLSPHYSLEQAINAIQNVQQKIDLPVDITTQFQGGTLAFQQSLSSTPWLILAAILCMYIVLGILYESFIHPLTILSTLPTAGMGALLALILTGRQLDIIAIIGIILLIGIVKKNAIMMIDFALAAERTQGMKPYDAIYQACLLRFRPILMTTLAALLGALPLMLSNGVGAELRQPLGICMVAGLVVSQLLTLFTTPVIYLLFSRLTRKNASFMANTDHL